jgi:tRNA(Ile2) C34 agmatinyltransferase TiaS
MAVNRSQRSERKLDVVSSILNWICPQCGGRMGGRGNEFKCQGECQTAWRAVWEQASSNAR